MLVFRSVLASVFITVYRNWRAARKWGKEGVPLWEIGHAYSVNNTNFAADSSIIAVLLALLLLYSFCYE